MLSINSTTLTSIPEVNQKHCADQNFDTICVGNGTEENGGDEVFFNLGERSQINTIRIYNNTQIVADYFIYVGHMGVKCIFNGIKISEYTYVEFLCTTQNPTHRIRISTSSEVKVPRVRGSNYSLVKFKVRKK